MNTLINLQDRILKVKEENFLTLALEVFEYQSKNNEVYAEYLHYLKKQEKPTRLNEIPFLPTEIFKHRIIKSGTWEEEIIFESSGTTQLIKSRHHVHSLDWYYKVAKNCFEHHYGAIVDYEFVGLIPSTDERPHSSLVAMCNFLRKESFSTVDRLSFMHDFKALYNFINEAKFINKKIILIGLSAALMDFIEVYNVEANNMIVIETGGMKSSHREIDKGHLLQSLKEGFPNAKIHSEYGMTEMMSQAYAMDGLHYSFAPIVKCMISDPTDPTQFLINGKRGVVNVIDLGNVSTCSFLQTGDLGILDDQNRLEILGRFDPEDVRGCTQLYE